MHLRFAPALSNDIHIGNLMVAMVNHIIAKQQGKKLILRIDQEPGIEQEKETELTNKVIKELTYFSIIFDEVIIQSKRQSIYRNILDILIKQRLAAVVNNVTYILIRDFLKEHNIRRITIYDSIHGKMTRLTTNFKNVIVHDRNNNTFMYTFTSCVDDILSMISHIIRGSDHIDNSFTQQIIKMIIRYATEHNVEHQINMTHLPLYKNTDNTKISKSNKKNKDLTVSELIKNNIKKETLYYYIFYQNISCKSFNIYNLYGYKLKQIGTKPKKIDINKINIINTYFNSLQTTQHQTV